MDRKTIEIGPVTVKVTPLKISKLEKISEIVRDDFTTVEKVQKMFGSGSFDFADMLQNILTLSTNAIYKLVIMVCDPIGDEKITVEMLEEHLDITHIDSIAAAFWEVNFDKIPFLIKKLGPMLGQAKTAYTDSGTPSSPHTRPTPLVEQKEN